MKCNTGKKRFLRDAIQYIKDNGPTTAGELHEHLRYTKTGKLLRDSPSRRQAQQILARCKNLESRMVSVIRTDYQNCTYDVNEYFLVGEQ